MQPDRSVLTFVETFAQKIISRDFAGAHHDLAPWLQRQVSPEDLNAEIDAEIRETLAACGETEACRPQTFEIDWNSSTIDSLRAERSYAAVRAIDAAITPQIFKHWLCIQVQPDPDQAWELDAFFDMWLIVVELDAGLAIGYYELLEPD